MATQSQYSPQTVVFDGGLDNISPSFSAAPGSLASCFNFERTDRLGYSRIMGYEYADGGCNPSLAYTNLVYITHSSITPTSVIRDAVWVTSTGSKIILGFVVQTAATQTLLAITDFDEWRKVLAGIPTVTITSASGDVYTVTDSNSFDDVYRAAQVDPSAVTAKTLTLARNSLMRQMNDVVDMPGSGKRPTIGLHGYKNQLYSITDLDVIYFENGNAAILQGDKLYPSGALTDENEVIVLDFEVLSGSFVGGDATGLILTNTYSHVSNGSWDIVRPQTTHTDALDFATIPTSVDSRSWLAGIYRTFDYVQATEASVDEGWNPVDSGWEFGFEDGTSVGPPAVYNRGDSTTITTDVLNTSDEAAAGSTVASNPSGAYTFSTVGAADIPTALASDDLTSYVRTVIDRTGALTAAGDISISDFAAMAGFSADSAITIKGMEVEVVAQFTYTDANQRTASLAVQPTSSGSRIVGSTFRGAVLPSDVSLPNQEVARVVLGGPEDLWGLDAATLKSNLNNNFGVIVQPYVSKVGSTYKGVIDVFYVKVTIYFTTTITDYYFWDGVDDVTAKITAVFLEDGAWEDNDAEGQMQVIDVTPVGTADRYSIKAGDEIRTSPGGAGILIGEVSNNMVFAGLPALKDLEAQNSRYEIITANFYANADFEAFYGVSGAGRAFSYDGFYFKRIYGVPDPALDLPRHVAFHQFHLALGYPSGSVQLSALGEPLIFDALQGAAEIGIGDPIVGFVRMNGTTLGVFCEKSIHGIVGTSSDNFSRQVLSPYEGAIEYTVLDMGGKAVYCSYRGISLFEQTAAYGDFAGNRLSSVVSPWLLPRIQGTISPVGEVAASAGPVVALACRTKNQYRLYFGDGYRLTMTLVNGQEPQFTIQAEGLYGGGILAPLFNSWIVPRAETSFVDITGAERIYLTHYSSSVSPPSGNYPVYEYERSWSFRGVGIPAYFVTNENFYGTSVDWEKLNKCRLFGLSFGYAPVYVHVEYNYKDNFTTTQEIQLSGPISLPRSPATSLTSDFVNTTNICNLASDGRSFNFRFMSYDLDAASSEVNPIIADVSPPFVIQGMTVQGKEGKGDV